MIERLSRFVLNETNIELNCIFLHNKPLLPKKDTPTTSLFWCIYQLVHPYSINPGFQEEQTFKFSSIEQMRKTYKQYRIKINDLEQSMLSVPNRECIELLCALYHLNVVIVYETYYYEYTGHGEGPLHYIYKPGDYYIGDPVDLSKKLSVDPMKPLYAISHYTLAQLKEMGEKLGISGTTKLDIYGKIKTHLL